METLPAPDHDDLDPDDDPDEATWIAALTGIDRDLVGVVLHAADAWRRAA